MPLDAEAPTRFTEQFERFRRAVHGPGHWAKSAARSSDTLVMKAGHPHARLSDDLTKAAGRLDRHVMFTMTVRLFRHVNDKGAS